jgi:uncharacterized protein YbjT (DUF2867 family)
MILITGGTGFIGSGLVNYLLRTGEQIRILLHPSRKSPKLPRGIAVEAVVSSFNDERSLRSAMKGIDIVCHLASAEQQLNLLDLTAVDVEGTRAIVETAQKANIKHLIFLSQIGADKNSHFAVFKAKALAEEIISHSTLNYTIFRLSTVFGPNDHFTTKIARGLRNSLLIFPLPGNQQITLQPLWINDLLISLSMAIRDEQVYRKIITIGGGEYFSFRQIVNIIMTKIHTPRVLIPLAPAYIRTTNLWLGRLRRGTLYSSTWLDYLAIDRTCALDTLPRLFGLLPARFEYKLDYLNAT